MINKIIGRIFTYDQPWWFSALNISILFPVPLWPLVLYISIFLFDHPQHFGFTFLIFLLIIAYPVYLILIAYFNSLLFEKTKVLASLVALSFLLTMLICISGVIFMVYISYRSSHQVEKKEAERKAKGYIGVNDDFKVIGNKVYLYDTLIAGADGQTFELVSWDWQRDTNYYYRFGKRVQSIDRRSFKLLGYDYGKDKYHVYYDENIIPVAVTKVGILPFIKLSNT